MKRNRKGANGFNFHRIVSFNRTLHNPLLDLPQQTLQLILVHFHIIMFIEEHRTVDATYSGTARLWEERKVSTTEELVIAFIKSVLRIIKGRMSIALANRRKMG